MSTVNNIERGLKNLANKLQKGNKNINFSLKDFLKMVSENPTITLRNTFQLIYDMMHYYIPEGVNEYPNDPESIHYIKYDCSNLFIGSTEQPFFADRLLANKLINVFDSFRQGGATNKMLLFVGPHGSGKSIFLNNLLHKLESYTKLKEGAMYETLWQIDIEKIGGPLFQEMIKDISTKNITPNDKNNDLSFLSKHYDKFLSIPCPSHDHPIIQIPKKYRKKLLDEIIEDKAYKRKLFYNKEYEWVLKKTPCAICTSIYRSLSRRLDIEEILQMLCAKRYEYDKKMGEGITIYNPGDTLDDKPIRNKELQKWIDALFKSSDAVTYIYSKQAKTNNGVFAIMDAKSNNIKRIKNIHSIISDGIHKVDTFEEKIDSLFITLINPEDINVISDEKSFLDRIIKIPIPYIRDYNTEIEIYKSVYGGGINNQFLPHVLEAFAKTIISSRLNDKSSTIDEWIKNPEQYSKFCDSNLHLLKLEIYSGNIPKWLTEEDTKKFNRKIRHQLILEGEEEGFKGFSGRESIEMFNRFYTKYKRKNKLINIEDLLDFFKYKKYSEKLPSDFLESLVNLYDYTVLQQIKEAMFFYNDEQISLNIINYFFAVNSEIGTKVKCPYTKETITVTDEYFESIESIFIGNKTTLQEREDFRNEVLKHYVAKTLQKVKAGIKIVDTEQYKHLHNRYNQSLKQNVLAPFINNTNFRRAIKDFDSDPFKNYDERVKEEVKLLIKNLVFKFNYTDIGAKQITLYVIDKDLCSKFPNK